MIVPLFGMVYVSIVGLWFVTQFGMVYACTRIWNGLMVQGRVTVDLHTQLQPEHQLDTVNRICFNNLIIKWVR